MRTQPEKKNGWELAAEPACWQQGGIKFHTLNCKRAVPECQGNFADAVRLFIAPCLNCWPHVATFGTILRASFAILRVGNEEDGD